MANNNYDVIVIGAGPGGYVAAIRCAQLGLKTACVDNWISPEGKASPGGTCLNVGCIPSKALLESSALLAQATSELDVHGIDVGSASIDIETMQSRKSGIVKKLTGGISQLLKGNKVDFIHGRGRVLPERQVAVMDLDSGKIQETLVATSIIIATGSTPVELPGFEFDHKQVLDSADVLDLKSVPDHLLIVGAGVIGLELGSVWARLGAKVTILEAMDSLLPALDPQLVRVAAAKFRKQGLNIILGARVSRCTRSKKGVSVEYELKEETQQIEADKLAVMVGRKPNLDGVLAPDCEIKTSPRGQIEVDQYCRTSVPGVWAIGDVVRGPMLAHKASEEGVLVAESIASGKLHALDLDNIPSVIYTHPEIATVGLTEGELKKQGRNYRVGNFPFAANGRALAATHSDGMIKILADAKTDRVLGVHIIGEHASELLAEGVFAIAYQASAEDLGRTIHAHPTLSETLREAALNVNKEAIHKMN